MSPKEEPTMNLPLTLGPPQRCSLLALLLAALAVLTVRPSCTEANAGPQQDPLVVQFTTPAGDPVALVTVLKVMADRLMPDNGLRIAANPLGTSIIVAGPPDQISLVRELLALPRPSNQAEFHVLKVSRSSAPQVARVLTDLNATKAGPSSYFRVVADPATNTVLVQCSLEHLAMVMDFLASRRALAASIAVAQDKDKPITQVFPLKHATAADAARVLMEVFRDKTGPKGKLAIGVDERSNTLIVTAAPDLVFDFAKLLQAIDVPVASQPAGHPELFIVRLNHADPGLVENALRLLFPAKEAGRFLVDRDQRLVLLYARGDLLDTAKALLSRLEESPGTAPQPNLEWQVRIIWLRNAPADDKAAKALPKDFADLHGDLAKLGLDRPAVAGQLMVRLTPQLPFEIAGDGPPGWKWMAHGRINHDPANQLVLDLTLSAGDQDGKTRPPVSLRTQVKLHSPKMMIVGAAPTRPTMSAFVVEVTAGLADKASPKKVGAFAEVPWAAAFEWLTEQTGLPVVMNNRPLGACPVPLAKKKLAPAEAVDFLNDVLMVQHYLLIRGDRTITLVPADERIDPSLVPRVTLIDLETRGKTELVSVALTLKSARADELAPTVKKMLSEFGTVVPVAQTNQLVLQDTAGNLSKLTRLILEIDNKGN
jgi:hypothetical protein